MATFEDVQKFANSYGFKPIQSIPEFKSLNTLLLPGENLKAIIEGLLKDVMGRSINGNGVVICTDRRLIFYRKTILGTTTKEEYAIENISSASSRMGILNASVEVRAGSNKATIEYLNKIEAEKFVKILQEVIYNKASKEALSAASQPPSQNQGPSIPEQLEKLFDLMQRGILTEDEFREQKARLLK